MVPILVLRALFLLYCCSWLFQTCLALPEPPHSQVLVINGKDELEAAARSYEMIVIKFYAPWCGHCKKMAPAYTDASIELQEVDPSIKLLKVDATDPRNQELKERFGIRGYPSIKVIKKGALGQATDYRGSRDAWNMVAQFKALRNDEPLPAVMDKKEGMKTMRKSTELKNKARQDIEEQAKARGEGKTRKERIRENIEQLSPEARDQLEAERADQERRKEEKYARKREELARKRQEREERLPPEVRDDPERAARERRRAAEREEAAERRFRERRGEGGRPGPEEHPGKPHDHHMHQKGPPKWADLSEEVKAKMEPEKRAQMERMAARGLLDHPVPSHGAHVAEGDGHHPVLRTHPHWDESLDDLHPKEALLTVQLRDLERMEEELGPPQPDWTEEERERWSKKRKALDHKRGMHARHAQKLHDHLNADDTMREPIGSFVRDVTEPQLKKMLKQHPAVLVKFYSPKEPRSRELWKEYSKAGQMIEKAFGGQVGVAKVNLETQVNRVLGGYFGLEAPHGIHLVKEALHTQERMGEDYEDAGAPGILNFVEQRVADLGLEMRPPPPPAAAAREEL